MIYVLAHNYDGNELKEFSEKREAEEFVATFLAQFKDYGVEVWVFEGQRLKIEPIEVVSKIKLIG